MSGIGLEFLAGYHFLKHSDAVDKIHEHMWYIAQFMFPFMILTSMALARTRNSWSFFFGILGMWKFGFPETVLPVSKTLMADQFTWQCLSDMLNAFGTLAH